MRISRMDLPTLGLAAALLASACGGDSGSNTSNQSSSQTGSGGSTSSSGGPSSCTPTRCPNDAQYNLFSQEFCDAEDKGPCAAQDKAHVQCALANETCTADGIQDRAKVQAACKAEIDAWQMCNATLAGSGS